MGKIKAGKPKTTAKVVPAGATRDAPTLRFSFRYLDLKHKKFGIARRDGKYLSSILDRFKSLSEMRAKELLTSRSGSLRVHEITWKDTSEPGGFTALNPQLREWPAHQFQVSANKHGRVHGFFIESVFFVVWLDPEHNLYP